MLTKIMVPCTQRNTIATKAIILVGSCYKVQHRSTGNLQNRWLWQLTVQLRYHTPQMHENDICSPSNEARPTFRKFTWPQPSTTKSWASTSPGASLGTRPAFLLARQDPAHSPYSPYYTILYYTILYYTILYCTILYYTILYYTITILYYTILYYTILYYTILYYTILYYTILYYTILYYTILYYTILYYTILYYTILYCTILYYTILCYTILYYTILYYTILYYTILYYTMNIS